MQQLAARRLFLEAARDVVEHEHEAAKPVGLRFVLAGIVHGRHLHPQQLAAARGGDELRRRLLRPPRPPVADALQRMRHQALVEHGVDGAPDADQLGAAGQLRRIRQRAELHARALVVEQDAAVAVAHHHALRQLRHQRRQPVALQPHAGAGTRHLGRHVGAQRIALRGQCVHRVGQRLLVGLRTRFQLQGRTGVDEGARLLGQLGQRADARHPPALQRRHGRHHAQRPGQYQQRGARRQQPGELRSARRVQREVDQANCHGQQHRQRQRHQHQRPNQQALVSQGAASSSSATFCTSSRVEKGLVM